jgi:hypothetical protein
LSARRVIKGWSKPAAEATEETKMRFLIIRKADAFTEGEDTPTPELFAAMGRYMEEMAKAGVLLSGDGLMPSRNGARVKFHAGTPTVTDGPFAETKELVAGFSIIQVGSREEAVEWVRKWPQIDGDGEVEIEIRQIYEADDFGAAFTPEERAREDKLRVLAENNARR